MIAHFVGGPWHGEDRAIEKANNRIIGVQAEALSVRYDDPSPFGPSYAEFEYERVRTAGGGPSFSRYVLYAYHEPKVDVSVAVEIAYDIFSYNDERNLSRLFLGVGSVGDGISQDNTHIGSKVLEVMFTVKVDGPPDGVAVATATTKVNAYLQRKLVDVRSATIKSVAASS